MATTYGERLLAEAEGRSRDRLHRRRLTLLWGPAAIATLLAIRGIWLARHAAMADVGLPRMALDHLLTLAYAVLFVLVPLALSIRPGLHRAPAVVAMLAGPIAMPLLFGPGSRRWQWLIVAAACAMVISAARRRRPTR